MRRLNSEEVRKLEDVKVICVYSNFEQLLNGQTDEQATRVMKPFYLTLIGDYQGEDKKIFDMGNGYYMIIDKQEIHKSVNKELVANAVEKPLPEFEHTTSIFKVVS